MAWKYWLRGLLAAFIGGAASAITMIAVDPLGFNLSAGLWKLGQVAVVLGITHGLMYLAKHPDPWAFEVKFKGKE